MAEEMTGHTKTMACLSDARFTGLRRTAALREKSCRKRQESNWVDTIGHGSEAYLTVARRAVFPGEM
jgi:hypothetical protein